MPFLTAEDILHGYENGFNRRKGPWFRRVHARRHILLHDMGINLRGLHISVAHQLLHDPNVNTVFEQMGGKAVPERVATDPLGNPGPIRCDLHRFLKS